MGDLGLPGSVVALPDATAQKNLWEVRKAGLNIMMSLKGDGKPVSFIEDCAVPLEHLADYTDALTEVSRSHGTHGTWYAHASVGTLHVRPILDMRRDGASEDARHRRRSLRAGAQVQGRVQRRARRRPVPRRMDRMAVRAGAQRGLRRHQDSSSIPTGLLNPGKIVAPPKMDDGSLLRFPPPSAPWPYETIALEPAFDWSAWNVQNDPVTERTTEPGTGGDRAGGLAKAVEMCNNNGHCRKFDAGHHVPELSRDARRGAPHARPRQHAAAGVIRAAWQRRVHERSGLSRRWTFACRCKGCRRECPTGVDMAKMKIEFLAHYKARHGYVLRDRVVARLPDYAAMASGMSWLFNLRDTLPGAAWLSEKLLGLYSAPAAPPLAQGHLLALTRHRALCGCRNDFGRSGGGAPAAVLFVDTFNGTFESENAHAAARVLRAAGYTLHTLTREGGHYCCGRTFLSTGMVSQARRRRGRSSQRYCRLPWRVSRLSAWNLLACSRCVTNC